MGEVLDRLSKLEAQPRLPNLLSVAEFAVLLKTTENAIRLKHARGQLPAPIGTGMKKLLWLVSDVSDWLTRK
jgi:predicted DNA-binding transcriptional regulator AlpA